MTMTRTSKYQGRSLLWARETLHKSGPHFPSALAMANRYKDELVRFPDRGMICFFDGRAPGIGDCAIYLGRGMVKMLDQQGFPYVLPLSEVRGTFLGAMHWPSVHEKVGEKS